MAVDLASLYPAVPTIPGLAVLHEKVTRTQGAGLAGAAAAVVLLSLA
ncbi:hypothetical protein ABZ079_18005 [Streptomyces sp. NPDC006314]